MVPTSKLFDFQQEICQARSGAIRPQIRCKRHAQTGWIHSENNPDPMMASCEEIQTVKKFLPPALLAVLLTGCGAVNTLTDGYRQTREIADDL